MLQKEFLQVVLKALLPESIFHLVSEIGVRWSWDLTHFAVIVRTHILISDKQADGSSESNTFFRSYAKHYDKHCTSDNVQMKNFPTR